MSRQDYLNNSPFVAWLRVKRGIDAEDLSLTELASYYGQYLAAKR